MSRGRRIALAAWIILNAAVIAFLVISPMVTVKVPLMKTIANATPGVR